MARPTAATQPPLATGTVGHYRWVVCALLFFATTVNYVDRQILALIKEFLDAELHWSNETFGWVNSTFQLAYAVGLLFFGRFVDRHGTRIGYAVSIALWSVAAVCHAAVGSVAGFFAARSFLGVSEGGNFPSAIKAVALWFPKRERALANSIFNAGTNVGAIVAPMMIPAIALQWGWRSTFVLAGAAGFLWLFFWLPLYDVPEKRRNLTKAEFDLIHSDRDEAGAGGAPLGELRALRLRQTWSFITAKFLTDPVWWFFLIWLPDYFRRPPRLLDIRHSWIHIVTIYTIVTVLSIAGGWVTGWLYSRGWTVTRARKTGMFIFALCVLPILAVTKVGDWPAVLLIGLAGAAHQAWSANLYTTVSDMFPKKDVATITGLGGMAGSAGGFLFPILTGRLLDRFTAAGNVRAGYAILFGVCAFAYLVAFAIHHALAPRFEPIPAEKTA
ncbi:MAG TPA: MFS transporter [Vicinamibacteria bacterium]|nr:MFS transporter [Vicinamibacteria bacterium]